MLRLCEGPIGKVDPDFITLYVAICKKYQRNKKEKVKTLQNQGNNHLVICIFCTKNKDFLNMCRCNFIILKTLQSIVFSRVTVVYLNMLISFYLLLPNHKICIFSIILLSVCIFLATTIYYTG